MSKLLTAAQMRAIERSAIHGGQTSGADLMERAGQGVVEAILTKWPQISTPSAKICVLCGPGNNGGDGFVVARLLRDRGCDVRVLAMAGDLPPDAKANALRWQGDIEDLSEANFRRQDAELIVDALFGTGLTRPLMGEAARVIALMNLQSHTAPVASIDAPSGLCLDSGRILGGEAAVRAALTVSFHAAKRGHYLQDGPDLCGQLIVKDIGLNSTKQDDTQADLVTPPYFAQHGYGARTLDKGHQRGAHKFDHGHVLVVAGGITSGGAARLAARAALRVGVGLVTLASPPSSVMVNASQLNAIMLTSVADADGLARVLEDKRLTSLILGPGLGHARARALVPVALAAQRATVLDADALSAYADEPDALFATLHDRCVLTPHMGEFARVFPDIAQRLANAATSGPAFSRLDAVDLAAARAGCTVLLKGPDTVISLAGAKLVHAATYDRAAPWLATAGSGDVLSGLIAGLLARGHPPLWAAWLHTECALEFGPGLISEDIAEQLPAVLRRVDDNWP